MQICGLLQTNSAVGPLRADTLNQRFVVHSNCHCKRLASSGQFVAGIYRPLSTDNFGGRLDLGVNLIDGHLGAVALCFGAHSKGFPRTLSLHIRLSTLGSGLPVRRDVAYRSVLQSDTVHQISRGSIRLRGKDTDSLDDCGDMRLRDVVLELSERPVDHLSESLRNHRCVSISGVGVQRKPSLREIYVIRVYVQAYGIPAKVPGGDGGRPRAHEGV